MVTQTLTLGKRRFVVLAEKDFRQLQKRAGTPIVRPQLGAAAMRELRKYKKTRKAADWEDVKRRLGL